MTELPALESQSLRSLSRGQASLLLSPSAHHSHGQSRFQVGEYGALAHLPPEPGSSWQRATSATDWAGREWGRGERAGVLILLPFQNGAAALPVGSDPTCSGG